MVVFKRPKKLTVKLIFKVSCHGQVVVVKRQFRPDGGAKQNVRRSPTSLGIIPWGPLISN